MVKVWKIKENKYFEIQSDWFNGWTAFLCADITFNFKDCDHPGWSTRLDLFKLWYLGFTYYDSRHWDMIEEDEHRKDT
jgi:hypothetical protein